jgi:hypothetical protein
VATDVIDDLPREHDVLVVEHEDHYALRRALGLGVNSTHLEGVPSLTFADQAEAVVAAEHAAAANGVDVWLVQAGQARLVSRHRPTREP